MAAVVTGYIGSLIGVGALCLALGFPARAFAKPAGWLVSLQYDAAPGCPEVEGLETAVVKRLGYNPFADEAAHHVSLRIARKAAALEGRIEWRDVDGRWEGDQTFNMASGECLRLARTMALALAVQIQLLRDRGAVAVEREAVVAESRQKAVAEAPEGKPTAEATRSAQTDEPPVASPSSTSSFAAAATAPRPSSSGAPFAFAIGAGPAVGLGMAPHPLVLGRVFGLMAWRHASIQLAAEASLPSTARRSDGAGVTAQLLLLSVAGCGSIERWSACLLANAGRVSLGGQDIDRPSSTSLPFVDAGLRAAFSQPLGSRAFATAHADGLVVLTRWTASLDDVPLWTTPRVAAAIGFDLGIYFR